MHGLDYNAEKGDGIWGAALDAACVVVFFWLSITRTHVHARPSVELVPC